jgi:hypothetical protein
MKTGTAAEQKTAFQIPLAITKVDKDKRLVRGVATAEVLDAHGQIVDYETAKAVFTDWVGNIREMHQPKAVGKRTAVEFDDEKKQIILESYISKGAQDTWEKVLDGTLSMYSIGGEGAIKKDAVAPKGRILMSTLNETSLVDSGACPVAKFDIVKMVDGVPTECQPEEPAAAAEGAAQPAATVSDRRSALLTLLEKAKGDLSAPQAQAAAVRAIAKIEALPPIQPNTSRVAKAYPEVYDIQLALSVISCLEQLLADEWWEARDEAVSAEGDGTAQAQLQLLRQAMNLVLAFLASEFDEQFSEFDDAAAGVAPDAAALAMAKRTAVCAVVAEFLAAGDMLTSVVKAGARHSKGDVEMIQKMHDTSVSLGAACGAEKAAATTTVEPVAPVIEKQIEEPAAAATEPPAAPDLQSIVKAAVAEALQAQKATSDTTIAELRERIDKLAGTPKPGGPVARAVQVEKQLVGTANEPAASESDEILRAFDVLSTQATTAGEKQDIAIKKLAYMHKNGIGAVQPVSGQPVK